MKVKIRAFSRYILIVLTVLNPFRFKQIYSILIDIEQCRHQYDSLDKQNVLIDDLNYRRTRLLVAEADLQFNLESHLKLI